MQVLSHMQTFQMQIPAITAIPEQTLVKFRYWVKFKLDVFRYQNLYGVITGGKNRYGFVYTKLNINFPAYFSLCKSHSMTRLFLHLSLLNKYPKNTDC